MLIWTLIVIARSRLSKQQQVMVYEGLLNYSDELLSSGAIVEDSGLKWYVLSTWEWWISMKIWVLMGQWKQWRQ